MNKIPTVEELIKGKSDSFDTQMRRDTYYKSTVENLMIEFAKIHVKAALEAASKKAETYYEPHWSGEQEGSTYIDKQSILNAYPDENIK